MISTIYCLLSKTGQDRINGIYRYCFRIIYCLYQCTNTVLHETFNLPTLDTKSKCLMKRLNSIQLYEPELIFCYLLRKNVANIVYSHYNEKACIPWLQKERPNKKLGAMYNHHSNCNTFLDKLLNFVYA